MLRTTVSLFLAVSFFTACAGQQKPTLADLNRSFAAGVEAHYVAEDARRTAAALEKGDLAESFETVAEVTTGAGEYERSEEAILIAGVCRSQHPSPRLCEVVVVLEAGEVIAVDVPTRGWTVEDAGAGAGLGLFLKGVLDPIAILSTAEAVDGTWQFKPGEEPVQID